KRWPAGSGMPLWNIVRARLWVRASHLARGLRARRDPMPAGGGTLPPPTRICPSRESDVPRRLQPLLALLAIVSLDAQNPPQPRPPTFRTEANYVRVDIYPTKDDLPVSDLTQADFEVLEGGALQKIEQFERVVIKPAGPQDVRIEPNNMRESLSMAQ